MRNTPIVKSHRLASIALVVLIGACLLGPSGCAGTGTGRSSAGAGTDTIVVYSDMLNPPFSSWDDAGKAVGLEVDLIAEAAAQLGRDVEWVERPFRDLLPAAAEGEADIAASTIGITEERARSVAFSLPYHWTEIVAVVRAGKSAPTSLGDLAGRKVGAGRGTTSETAIAARLPQAIAVLDRPDDVTFDEMLADGSIDAMVLDAPAAERMIAAADVTLRRLAEPLGHERYAFAVHPDAGALLEAIDAVIAARIEAP